MIPYLVWWLGGGVVGLACSVFVVRRPGRETLRVLAVLAAAFVAALYGAKVQHRLGLLPLPEALLFGPAELLRPGFHIPLGGAFAFAAAIAVARLVAVPLLDLADGLAIAGMVMTSIGRVGCMLVGCCKGTVCPWWMAAVCIRAEPIEGSTLVHPLAVYLALLALGTLALDVWLLRRRVPPGTVAAVTFFIHPLGRLALERLRGVEVNPSSVMTSVLVGMLIADVVLTGLIVLRHRRQRSRHVDATPAELPQITAAALPEGGWR